MDLMEIFCQNNKTVRTKKMIDKKNMKNITMLGSRQPKY